MIRRENKISFDLEKKKKKKKKMGLGSYR